MREYNLKQILNSGENDMIDEHINKQFVEQLLDNQEEKKDETPVVDLNKTLNEIENNNLYESIINLKNRDVE